MPSHWNAENPQNHPSKVSESSPELQRCDAGEKNFRTLLNVNTPCTLQSVRNALYEQARISDSQTGLALEDENGAAKSDAQNATHTQTTENHCSVPSQQLGGIGIVV
eukprot:6283382-Amphidinium_carterae.1